MKFKNEHGRILSSMQVRFEVTRSNLMTTAIEEGRKTNIEIQRIGKSRLLLRLRKLLRKYGQVLPEGWPAYTALEKGKARELIDRLFPDSIE